MAKVYAVTSGDYSAYHIDRIFSTEEVARQFAAIDDKYDVEEFDLDEDFDQTKLYKYDVYVATNRAVSADMDEWPDDDPQTTIQKQRTNGYAVSLWARNQEYAKKQAYDLMMQVKALQQTHFPLLHKRCVVRKDWDRDVLSRAYFPKYDLKTYEVILTEDEMLLPYDIPDTPDCNCSPDPDYQAPDIKGTIIWPVVETVEECRVRLDIEPIK